MIHESEFLRVWTAGTELFTSLPPEIDAPGLYHGEINDIDLRWHNGIKYCVFRTCDWHVDWSQVFEYVVVRGHGRLCVGPLDNGLRRVSESPPKTYHTVKIQRGDVIQLWPLALHRGICRGSVAMLCNDIARIEDTPCRFLGFQPTVDSEGAFLHQLRDAKHPIEPRGVLEPSEGSS